jgi:ABC-type transport system involved in multi-copper enzyme maturation permease subunit
MTTVTQPPATQTTPATAAAVPGPTLGRLTRSELLKVRTTNLWWIFGLCALVATGLALTLNSIIAHVEITDALNPPDFTEGFPPGQGPTPEDIAQMEADWRASHVISDILVRSAANIFTSGQYFGLLIVMMLGTLMVTNEIYHQTATTTFLTAPRRTVVIMAKVTAAVIVAGALWLATTIIDLGVGAIFFSAKGQPNSLDVWDVQRAILMNLPAYVLWALLGLGLGALIRNQIAATLVGAGLYLIGGQVAQLVFIAVYSFWIKQAWVLQAMVVLPAMASSVMIAPTPPQIWATETGEAIYAPQWWVGALVLVAYGVVATGLGTLLIRRRDVG